MVHWLTKTDQKHLVLLISELFFRFAIHFSASPYKSQVVFVNHLERGEGRQKGRKKERVLRVLCPLKDYPYVLTLFLAYVCREDPSD
jgi:hypothetical protein